MVKTKCILYLFIYSFIISCGESPPKPIVIDLTMNNQTKKKCEDLDKVFLYTKYNKMHFDCFKAPFAELLKSTNQKKINYSELSTLIDHNLLIIDKTKSIHQNKLQLKYIFILMNLKKSITLSDFNQIEIWIKDNWKILNAFTKSFITNKNNISSDDIYNLALLLEALIKQFKWQHHFNFDTFKQILIHVFNFNKREMTPIILSKRLFQLKSTHFQSELLKISKWLQTNKKNLDGSFSFFATPHQSKIDFHPLLNLLKNFIIRETGQKNLTINQLLHHAERLFNIDKTDIVKIEAGLKLLNINIRDQDSIVKLNSRINWFIKHINQIQNIIKSISQSDHQFSKENITTISILGSSFLDEVKWNRHFPFSNIINYLNIINPHFTRYQKKIIHLQQILNIPETNLTIKMKGLLNWSNQNAKNISLLVSKLKRNKFSINQDEKDLKFYLKMSISFLNATKWQQSYTFDMFYKNITHLFRLNKTTQEKLYPIANFLDFSSGNLNLKLNQRLQWLQQNINWLFRLKSKINQGSKLFENYNDISIFLNSISQFTQQLTWSKSSLQLKALVQKIVPLNSHFKKNLVPTLNVLLDTFKAVCPTSSKDKFFTPQQLSSCLDKLNPLLCKAKEWIDYSLKETPPFLNRSQISSIQLSLEILKINLRQWFSHENLSGIHVPLWIEFSKSIGAPPPTDFINDLKFFRMFGPNSNENFIHPNVFKHIVKLIYQHQNVKLQTINDYKRAVISGECKNTDATNWEECILTTAFSLDLKHPIHSTLAKISDQKYGTSSHPFNGKQFQTTHYFYIIANEIIRLFDKNNDGLIRIKSDDKKDEIISLLKIGVQATQSFSIFVENIKRRINNLPIIKPVPIFSLNNYNLKGIARLISIAGTDILVNRTPRERNVLKKLLDNLISISPKNSIYLDNLAITAIIVFIDSLSSYQDTFKKYIGEDKLLLKKGRIIINKIDVINAISLTLNNDFPRTLKWCQHFGYQQSCEIFYRELLEIDDNKEQFIYLEDLDLMTIIATSLEGILDTCDKSLNEKLSFSLINGNDELSCTTKLFINITQRLIQSKIIDDQSAPSQKLLNFLKFNELTRVFGKVALIKGTLKGVIWGPIRIPLYLLKGKKANLGSITSLLSDIINPEKDRNSKDSL